MSLLGLVGIMGCGNKDFFSAEFGDLFDEIQRNGSLRVIEEPYFCVYDVKEDFQRTLITRKTIPPGFSPLKRLDEGEGHSLRGESEEKWYRISGWQAEVYRAVKYDDEGYVLSEVFVDLTRKEVVFSCPHDYW